MLKLSTLLFLSILAVSSFAQPVEDEVGFIYVKAEYLYQTERYHEAIDQYSSIISQDPSYEDALVKRASSKYMLGNYSGAKEDITMSISHLGISQEAIRILGLSDYGLGNYKAAAGSLALSYAHKNADLLVAEGLAQSYYETDRSSKACKVAKKAKSLGSTKAGSWERKYCNQSSKSDEVVSAPKSGKKTKAPKKKSDAEIDIMDSEDQVLIEDSEEEVKDEIVVDDTETRIDIDEDLQLVIKNGLGSRKIMDKPNILILSDQTGDVAVDVCVSKAGRVESAELNVAESSIETQSLQNLAIRKAKEFWFERMGTKPICGTIVFEIKGR